MPLMWAEPDINASVVASVCSRCGIEVVSLEPSFDTLPIFLEASPPDVKALGGVKGRCWPHPSGRWRSPGGGSGVQVPLCERGVQAGRSLKACAFGLPGLG